MKRIFAALLLALALTGCAGVESPPLPTATSEPPAVTDPVPANTYDPADFVAVDGFLTYQEGGYIGVDVSSYQQDIDWQRVAEAGVDFAMIRVGFRGYGSGELVEDSRFRQNIEGALAAGLDVGVYFFSQAVHRLEAVEEARFLLERIRDYDITYPVVFDWERQTHESSRTARTPGWMQTACAAAFCRTVEAAGYQPMVYFSPSKAYDELDLERLMEWPFWLAHYTQGWQPTGFRYHFAMWQYTCEGQVDGIETPVDLNLCLTDFTTEGSPYA